MQFPTVLCRNISRSSWKQIHLKTNNNNNKNQATNLKEKAGVKWQTGELQAEESFPTWGTLSFPAIKVKEGNALSLRNLLMPQLIWGGKLEPGPELRSSLGGFYRAPSFTTSAEDLWPSMKVKDIVTARWISVKTTECGGWAGGCALETVVGMGAGGRSEFSLER